MPYKYTNLSNIFNKEKYMYSNIYHNNFYKSYRANRSLYSKKININSLYKKLDTFKIEKEISSTQYFLYKNIISIVKNNRIKNKDIFNKLIRKFEIKNKIYDINTSGKRYDHNEIKIYILFSLNILHILLRKTDFRLLNSFLKCNDCIISLYGKKKEQKYFDFICYIIGRELMFIKREL